MNNELMIIAVQEDSRNVRPRSWSMIPIEALVYINVRRVRAQHRMTRREVSCEASGPDASGVYDASGGVGARRVVKLL